MSRDTSGQNSPNMTIPSFSASGAANAGTATLPQTFRLPKNGERDPHFGLSRAWYYAAEADGRLTLLRLRQKGKKRGTTLVPTSAVLELLEGAK